LSPTCLPLDVAIRTYLSSQNKSCFDFSIGKYLYGDAWYINKKHRIELYDFIVFGNKAKIEGTDRYDSVTIVFNNIKIYIDEKEYYKYLDSNHFYRKRTKEY